MSTGKHHGLPSLVSRPDGTSVKPGKRRESRSLTRHDAIRNRSRSPLCNQERLSPPSKKPHVTPAAGPSHLIAPADPVETTPSPLRNNQPAIHSFLLTNFDPKYQQPKLLLLQIAKYQPRTVISQIIPTRNGVIIKTPNPDLATSIRNKHSFEIFGHNANLAPLTRRNFKETPPPRRPPTLSVVIRGVDPSLTDDEIASELEEEGYSFRKCIRIRNNVGPTYLVRILTDSQTTIDDLLEHGVLIYKKKHKVEPSRTSTPLPLRCEKCQQYNLHPTEKCSNQPKCGYCSGTHLTRDCTNIQQPPKCSTCAEQHPTYSYKCKSRPTPLETQPELVVPIRTHDRENQTDHATVSQDQPVTIGHLLSFFTLTLQNIHPFLRPLILHHVQHAAKTIFHINFHATYNGPYAHFHSHPLETAV